MVNISLSYSNFSVKKNWLTRVLVQNPGGDWLAGVSYPGESDFRTFIWIILNQNRKYFYCSGTVGSNYEKMGVRKSRWMVPLKLTHVGLKNDDFYVTREMSVVPLGLQYWSSNRGYSVSKQYILYKYYLNVFWRILDNLIQLYNTWNVMTHQS